MKPSIILPISGDSNSFKTIQHPNSIVIIGKNGSGKSRLGIKIEENIPQNQTVKRISAQKALQIPPNIMIQNIENAEKELMFGILNKPENYFTKLTYLYQNKPHNFVLNDFQRVLSLLFAKKSLRDSNVVKSLKNGSYISVDDSVTDKIEKIWTQIYPQRQIIFEDSKVQAKHPTSGVIYDGTDMSDGERVALYLMAQILCVPNNTVIILDEPETHLNKTIINQLWNLLEDYRQDCLFVYITHNLEFAKGRKDSKSLLIDSYDGYNWVYSEISGLEDLPSSVLMDLIGPRKKILFVEGDEDSLDTQIYSEFYKSFKVIPVASCENVIKYTQSINSNTQIHSFEAFGLIDRDHRSDAQITKLETQKVFSLKVAESENLMISESVMKTVGLYLKVSELDKKIEEIKEEVLQMLQGEIENQKQPTDYAGQHLKYALGSFEINHRNKDALQAHFDGIVSQNIDDIYTMYEEKLNQIVVDKNYEEAIKYYNRKSLIRVVATKFGLSPEGYLDQILNSIKEDCVECQRDNIIRAIAPLLPRM